MILPIKGKINMFGGGRNWIILVFSLLLAFFMWSIMKLSARYSSYVKYQVEVKTNIPGRKSEAKSTDVLVIGAKSSGFRIIQNKDGDQDNTLAIDMVDEKYFHKYGDGDVFYLIPDNIRQRIQDALGTDMVVESFATDTLFFVFPKQSNRKVPVMSNSVVTYAKQYMPYSPMTIKPDSVLIYGNEDIISRIDYVATKAIKSNNASRTITGVVGLVQVAGVRYSDDEVFYSQEVGRFVESTIKVPVTIGNAPSYANVAIIPQEMTVRCRQPFGKSEQLAPQDFSIVVEYDEILRKDVLKPKIERMPEGILSCEMEPKFVECVL